MKKMMLIGRGMFFGIIGALIGGIPNSVLKTFIGLSDFGEICFTSFKVEIGWDLAITPCGIYSRTFWSLFGTFVPTIIGGALFGFIGMQIGCKRAEKWGKTISKENWKDYFWWSFAGGVLFDLIFIFMIIYIPT